MRVIAAARSATRAQTDMAVRQLARITGGLLAARTHDPAIPEVTRSERWPSRSVRCRASLAVPVAVLPAVRR